MGGRSFKSNQGPPTTPYRGHTCTASAWHQPSFADGSALSESADPPEHPLEQDRCQASGVLGQETSPLEKEPGRNMAAGWAGLEAKNPDPPQDILWTL